jgi:HlyD family secretion protein
MEKKSKSKIILILISLFAVVILISGLSGCQVLSRLSGKNTSKSNSLNAVETFTVKRADIIQSMSTTGTVDSSETKNLPVKISGEVLESTKVGSQVKKGDLLLKVDNSDLLLSIKESQINVEVAEISLKDVQISYKAALDANHIAVQVAQLDNQASQQSVDEALAGIDNTDRTGSASIESARLALEKAQDSFNFSISQAQISLNQAADKLNSNPGDITSSYSYQSSYLSRDSAIATATNSLDSATATLIETDAKARASSETAQSSYEQALVSQSKTYWNTLSSLEQARQKIQSAINSINSSQKKVELAKISLESASKNLNGNTIVAPFDGIILTSNYNKGENAAGNSTAITIASNDFLVKSSVNETDISKVSVGNKVTLTFDAYPEQEFEAEVMDISGAPTVSNNITSYAITVKLKNTGKIKLFYGLTTNLTVITAEAKNALIVPVQAVYTENGKQYVDVIDNAQATGQQSGSEVPNGTKPDDATRTSRTIPSGGTFPDSIASQNAQASAKNTGNTAAGISATKKVEIITGINNYTYYEVLSGLKEGDQVITSGS